MNNMSNNTQQNKVDNKSRRSLYISLFCFLSIFFFGMLILRGVPLYNDSKQYMDMHVHREPVYPLFLWITRMIAGEHSLIFAGILQCALAVYASFRFITYVLDNVCLKYIVVKKMSLIKWIIVLALTLTVITPYIITPLMSATHVMLATGILSEALAVPLFLLFVVSLHKLLVDRTDEGAVIIRHIAFSFIISLLLSLTRSQMIVTLIAWSIAAMVSAITATGNMKSKAYKLVIIMLIFIVSLPLRTTVTKTYNFIFNGRYVDNVYSNVTMLSNIFYVTDRESGELIEDEDLRTIFYRLYDVMDENEWSYKYAGDTATDRAIYLEDMHDMIKFDVIEAGFRDIMNERGMPEYIDYNLKAEEYSGRLIKILWPRCFGKWLADWFIMGCRGVVRSIAVIHPVMFIYSLLAMVYLVFAMAVSFKREANLAAYAFIALLLLMGNAFGTSFTIMCLSRYMIYGFILFYSAIIVLFARMIYNRHDEKQK